jgi:hypothetical protein
MGEVRIQLCLCGCVATIDTWDLDASAGMQYFKCAELDEDFVV